MHLNAVWAYFVVVGSVIGFAALPIFRFIESSPSKQSDRYRAIDGLRGFLALSVFVFHLIITHQFIETGLWEVPRSAFYRLLGPVSVSLFFLITGFLFWGKMLHAKGRPRWDALYVGRLFRIAPMYLFVVLAMLFIVFARTGFQLHEPAHAVAASVLQWLALGMIDTQPDVNGYQATHVLASVTWTIAYEWAFYFSLLATAYFARGRSHLIFVLCALAVCMAAKVFLGIHSMGFAVLFLSGMTVASLLHENISIRMPDSIASAVAVLCLLAIFSMSPSGYGTFTAALLAVFFYLVCSGASLFGLLTTAPAHRLGNISYSLYLMQGLVLTLVLSIPPIKDFAMQSALKYWATGIVCAYVLVLCAALGYAFIERPGIALGKRLISQRRGAAGGSTQHAANMERVA